MEKLWWKQDLPGRMVKFPGWLDWLGNLEGPGASYAEREVAAVVFEAKEVWGNGVGHSVRQFDEALEAGSRRERPRSEYLFTVPYDRSLQLARKYRDWYRQRQQAEFRRRMISSLLWAPWTLPAAAVCGFIGFGLRFLPHEEIYYHPASTGSLTLAPENLAILTFNVALTEFEIMNFINAVPTTASRLPRLASVLIETGADIICLQEAFDVSRLRKFVFPDMDRAGYNVLAQVNRAQYFGMASGLVIFSRFPVVAAGFHEFGDRRGHDALAKKGVLASVLQISASSDPKYLLVATTHVQAGFSVDGDLSEDEKDRIRAEVRGHHLLEARRFCQYMFDQCASQGIEISDVVLTGDLNTSHFDRIDKPFATVSYDWNLVHDMLCDKSQNSEQLMVFKDLTAVNVDVDFESSSKMTMNLAEDLEARYSETGENRGTSVRCEAPVAAFFREIVEMEARELGQPISELVKPMLDQACYVEPAALDHILLAELPSRQFSETGYQYQAINCGTVEGLLSDHRAVRVRLHRRDDRHHR